MISRWGTRPCGAGNLHGRRAQDHVPRSRWKRDQMGRHSTVTGLRPRRRKARVTFSPMLTVDVQWQNQFLSFSISPPPTFQSVLPVVDQHLPCTRGLDCAWLMRWEPVDALDRRERTCSRTVRTFHSCDGTRRTSFEIDGNHHSRKRACGCCARQHRFFHRFHRLRRVLVER